MNTAIFQILVITLALKNYDKKWKFLDFPKESNCPKAKSCCRNHLHLSFLFYLFLITFDYHLLRFSIWLTSGQETFICFNWRRQMALTKKYMELCCLHLTPLSHIIFEQLKMKNEYQIKITVQKKWLILSGYKIYFSLQYCLLGFAFQWWELPLSI